MYTYVYITCVYAELHCLKLWMTTLQRHAGVHYHARTVGSAHRHKVIFSLNPALNQINMIMSSLHSGLCALMCSMAAEPIVPAH